MLICDQYKEKIKLVKEKKERNSWFTVFISKIAWTLFLKRKFPWNELFIFCHILSLEWFLGEIQEFLWKHEIGNQKLRGSDPLIREKPFYDVFEKNELQASSSESSKFSQQVNSINFILNHYL